MAVADHRLGLDANFNLEKTTTDAKMTLLGLVEQEAGADLMGEILAFAAEQPSLSARKLDIV